MKIEVKSELKIDVKGENIGVIKALGFGVYFRVKFCKDMLNVHGPLFYDNEQANEFYFNVKLKRVAARRER